MKKLIISLFFLNLFINSKNLNAYKYDYVAADGKRYQYNYAYRDKLYDSRNIPEGSYKNSCKDCTINNTEKKQIRKLTCECLQIYWEYPTFKNSSIDISYNEGYMDIVNNNGKLEKIPKNII